MSDRHRLERLVAAGEALDAFATWSALNRPEVQPFRDELRAASAYLATPPAPTEDATLDARARLAEAIEGERRDWHTVEVRPDDLAALLARVSAPITEGSPLTGMLVRDCTCKRVHDHYEELGS